MTLDAGEVIPPVHALFEAPGTLHDVEMTDDWSDDDDQDEVAHHEECDLAETVNEDDEHEDCGSDCDSDGHWDPEQGWDRYETPCKPPSSVSYYTVHELKELVIVCGLQDPFPDALVHSSAYIRVLKDSGFMSDDGGGEGSIDDALSGYLENARKTPWSYYKCSAEELRSFVLARGLLDPKIGGLADKDVYVRILRQGDADRTFPLLDLPPELRSLIYSDVLGPPLCDCADCHIGRAQILRVSKLIHKEAADVLYEQNTITCRFAASLETCNDDHPASLHAMLHREKEDDKRKLKSMRLKECMAACPDFFRRIRHLRIIIILADHCSDDVHNHGTGSAHKFLRKRLLALASFLMGNHQLQSLEIHAHFPAGDSEDVIAETLYPVRRLRNVANIKMTGDVPKKVGESIIAELQTSVPAFDTLKIYHVLRAEAVAYLRLVGAVDDAESYGMNHGAESISDRVCEVLGQLDALVQNGAHAFSSLDAEQSFIYELSKLQDVLREIHDESVASAMKEYTVAGQESRKLISKAEWTLT